MMTEAQIKHMVDRFLMWRLPKTFSPDNGISYTRTDHHRAIDGMPNGTNVFSYAEADMMVRHMLDGLPSATLPAKKTGKKKRARKAARPRTL